LAREAQRRQAEAQEVGDGDPTRRRGESFSAPSRYPAPERTARAMTKPCPECGSTDRKEESGEYALIKLSQGRLQLHTEAPRTEAIIARATVCANCSYVALYEIR
jgi:hypothetical protein